MRFCFQLIQRYKFFGYTKATLIRSNRHADGGLRSLSALTQVPSAGMLSLSLCILSHSAKKFMRALSARGGHIVDGHSSLPCYYLSGKSLRSL